MLYLGIDPGKEGGIALINEEGSIYALEPFGKGVLREVIEMRKALDEKVMCVLEKVHAMPGQGVNSMFTFGEGFGYIEGTLEALSVPYEMIPPQKWEKEFSLCGKSKTAACDTAERLFPTANLYKTERCRKRHDGMADALLMAEYGRRKLREGGGL